MTKDRLTAIKEELDRMPLVRSHVQLVLELYNEMLALRAENDRLRKSVLNQCGDNLCHLTDEDIKQFEQDLGKIPPWEQFSISCHRFHQQVSAGKGVLRDGMTIAQLEAVVQRRVVSAEQLFLLFDEECKRLGTVALLFGRGVPEDLTLWDSVCDKLNK